VRVSGGRDARAILDDREGRRSVSFQEAVEAIAAVVAPDRADELGDLAEQSPNRVRRVLDDLLDRHPVDSGTEEKVLRVAWAYGELRFVRSLARQASPRARSRAEAWARARLEARRERRRREREAGAAFDSRPSSLGGDVPDAEVRIVHSAIRLFDGTVLGTPEDGTHPDVVAGLEPGARARLAREVESEGFVDAHGNYLHRGEASIVTGVSGESTQVAGTLQGQPLRRVQEASLERPPASEAAAIELDEDAEAEARAFLDQFRIDRSL
jgi:hypothetical protein